MPAITCGSARSSKLYAAARVAQRRRRQRVLRSFFSNDGLWRSRISATRPIFRPEDWLQYQKIQSAVCGRRSARNGRHRIADITRAGLPLRVCCREWSRTRARRSSGRSSGTSLAERGSFGFVRGSCELVDGSPGRDLIGFHRSIALQQFSWKQWTRARSAHRVDRFAVNRQGHITRVGLIPSAWRFSGEFTCDQRVPQLRRRTRRLCDEMRVEASLLGVGVDRVATPKESSSASARWERFFEMNPAYQRG